MYTSFIHYPLNQEITAIGGHYCFIKEVRLLYQGREILYRLACATVDSACCGVGGLGYVLVPGFIVAWHTTKTRDGLLVSQVEPIAVADDRKAIEKLIKHKEKIQQVNFQ
jgi:hypothetical protein